MLKSTSERFWEKVEKSDDCWKWTASLTKGGYGSFSLHCKTVYAHRLAWILTNGEIPDNLSVCHTCDVPSCVRPDHLFLGTQSDNAKDMVSKGRNVRITGARHSASFLTEDQIIAMRREHDEGASCKFLGDKYGMSDSNVSRIVRRERWKN